MKDDRDKRENRDEIKEINRRTVKEALKTSFPIMVTFIVLGSGYGMLLQRNGYGPQWAFLSGIVIFSGTTQFVSVTMLQGTSLITAAITALMISARYIFFSTSMIRRYKKEGARRWYLHYALCDETYAMLSKRNRPKGINRSNYRMLVTAFDQGAWVFGSVLGGVLGGLLDFDSTGIEFAMTALFVTVFLEQWLEAKVHLPALLGVGSSLLCRLLFGRDYFLIPAMVIIIAVLTGTRDIFEPIFEEESSSKTAEHRSSETSKGGVQK